MPAFDASIFQLILSQKMGNVSGNIKPCPRLTCSFVALVSRTFLLPTVMLCLERSLMAFLLLKNCVENCQEINSVKTDTSLKVVKHLPPLRHLSE